VSDGRLVFIRPDDGTGRLVFGDDSGVETPATEFSIDATFANDMQATVELLWDANVSRVQTAFIRTLWQDAEPATARAAARWQDSRPIAARTAALWQDAAPATARTSTRWQDSRLLNTRTAARWQDATAERYLVAARWQDEIRLRALASAHWQDAPGLRHTLVTHWQEQLRLRATASTHWQNAIAQSRRFLHTSGPARPVHHAIRTRWQDARHPLPGRSLFVPPDPPLPEPCYDPETLGQLEFSEPWANDGRLVFVCIRGGGVAPPAPVFILPARYYMAVHSLTAHILPGLTQIPIFDVALSADVGSFAWTFNASGPVDLFEVLAPSSGQPVQIRITLDGIAFTFLVEQIQHEDRFGRRGVRISGRSITALLASPYARESTRLSTEARTAQQLALASLEFTDFGLDWGLTDWLVPAGAWSHLGTPLAALQAIAEAPGGYLQSARNAATLLVRHPYPILPGGIQGGPWDWEGDFAADVELAPDALFVTSIERRDGPDLNGVYVRGTTMGVSRLVRRTLSAGEKLGPLATDPLITANEAAGQRGMAILGAAGPKHIVQIELPVLTGLDQPGVLDVGQLVQINHASPWRGRVRSVSVNARMPKARQTVTLERHLETV
jgi:hypothetical protein